MRIRKWSDALFDSVEPTTEAVERYYDAIREALPNTVWTTGCNSWYLGKDGLPELWPWSPGKFRQMMRRTPNSSDFRLAFRVKQAAG